MINWRPRMCVSARELAINCHYLLVLVCALVRATSLRFLLVFDILAVVVVVVVLVYVFALFGFGERAGE